MFAFRFQARRRSPAPVLTAQRARFFRAAGPLRLRGWPLRARDVGFSPGGFKGSLQRLGVSVGVGWSEACKSSLPRGSMLTSRDHWCLPRLVRGVRNSRRCLTGLLSVAVSSRQDAVREAVMRSSKKCRPVSIADGVAGAVEGVVVSPRRRSAPGRYGPC